MKLTQQEIKSMRDNKACPCCGKGLTSLEVTHLAGSENGEGIIGSKNSEAYRRTGLPDGIELPNGRVINLHEAARSQEVQTREAAVRSEFEAEIQQFMREGMSRQAAESAAAGFWRSREVW